MSESQDWLIYQGSGMHHDGIRRLPPPPPWRESGGVTGAPFLIAQAAVERVNAALYLRRPLLVTGPPGSGKSSLAESVAAELGLGPVLRWHITSRSTLLEGLYAYDAIARLQDASLTRSDLSSDLLPNVGSYVRLGPLGTALLPGETPRVLLIDELDKSDIDLPSDILNVLEYGEFAVPELVRLSGDGRHFRVATSDYDAAVVDVGDGRVRCRAFPFVVITSNGEREFPPALLRRCVHLEIPFPSHEMLMAIVTAHLGPELAMKAEDVIARFLERREYGDVATDQLLNAVYLAGLVPGDATEVERLADILLRAFPTDDF
jgi:MoxR-like ATPase